MLINGSARNRKPRVDNRRRKGTVGRSQLAMESLEHRLLLTTGVDSYSSMGTEALGDWFGESVALYEGTEKDIAVVGAPQDDGAGAAYVYQRTGDTWSQPTPLIASGVVDGDLFGSSVAIHKDVLVVGASGADDANRNAGAVHVFHNNGIDWNYQGKLPTPSLDRSAQFGERAALDVYQNEDGISTIVVGAHYQGRSGDAYVYYASQNQNGDGLSFTDPISLANNVPRRSLFGESVAVANDTIVVGAHDGNALYVFEESLSTPTVLETSLDNERLGFDVAISDNERTIVASSMTRTFVFERNAEEDSTWADPFEVDELDPVGFDPTRFGWSLDMSLNGKTIVVGALSDENNAYVFNKTGADWSHEYTLNPSSTLEGLQGYSVATNGTIALVGARADSQVLAFHTPMAEPPPGISVSPTAGLVTREDPAGVPESFDVVLDTAPTVGTAVTIDVSASDPSEGSVAPVQLTFSSDNWDSPQTVTVTGVDDLAMDGDITFTITLDPTSSTDPDYASLTPIDILATNYDNDTAPIADAGRPYTVDEGGQVVVDATGSSDSDLPYDTLTYAWDFSYTGYPAEFNNEAEGETATFDSTGLAAGEVAHVAVRVTDSAGNESLGATTVTVQEAATQISYDYTGDPKTIGDLKTVTTTIGVSDQHPIASLQVRLNLTHASPDDLVASLTSPNGIEVTLVGPIASGDRFYEVSYPGTTGPGDLQLDGTWTLEVTDQVKNRKRGTLIDWSLVVTPLPPSGAAAIGSPAAAFDASVTVISPPVRLALTTSDRRPADDAEVDDSTQPRATPDVAHVDSALTNFDYELLPSPAHHQDADTGNLLKPLALGLSEELPAPWGKK